MKHPRAEPAQQRLDVVLEPDDAQRLANLNGPFDAHLRQIELRLGIEIRARGNRFRLVGPEADIARGEEILRALFALAADAPLSAEHVHLALAEQQGPAVAVAPAEEGGEIVVRTKRGTVRGRSDRQREYLRDIATHDLTFGIGPAGTGKTSTNRPVNFDGAQSLIGRIVDVTVTEALTNSLRGRLAGALTEAA